MKFVVFWTKSWCFLVFDLHTLFGNSVLDFFWKNISSPVHWGFANFGIISWKNTKNNKKAPKINILTKSYWRKTFCIFSKVTWRKVRWFYSMFSNLLIFHVETTLDWCVDTDLWKKHHCWQGATFHVLFTSIIWKLEQFGTIPHPIRNPWKCCNFPQPFLYWK